MLKNRRNNKNLGLRFALCCILIAMVIVCIGGVSALTITNSLTPTGSTTPATPKQGMKIQVLDSTTSILGFYKFADASADITKGYILANGTLLQLATCNFVGAYCELSSPLEVVNGTFYWLLVDNNGANYATRNTNPATLPIINTTYIRWDASTSDGGSDYENNRARNIQSVEVNEAPLDLPITLELTSPTDDEILSTDGTTFIVNGTISQATPGGMNFTNVTYYVWNTNHSLFNSTYVALSSSNVTGSSLFINSFTLGQNYIWNANFCWKNATFHNCSFAPANYTFSNLPVSVTSATYNATAIGLSNQSFSINFSANPAVSAISSYFWYNNTRYSQALTSIGSGNYRGSYNLLTPYVTSEINKTFFWEFIVTTTSGILYQNTSNYTQILSNIQAISVTNATCSAGFSPAFTFNLGIETNLTTLSQNINYVFYYGVAGGNNTALSQSGNFTGVSNFNICVNSSISYYSVGYGEIEYQSSGYEPRRYYIFENTRATNITTTIPLYSLPSASATSFLFTAQSTSLTSYKGYYLALLRWYANNNSYKIVEMGKTDDKGQVVMKVEAEDIDYRLALYETDGTLIQLGSPLRFICQTTPCTYTLFVDTNPLDLTSYTNIEGNLSFNHLTKIFTFIWNDPSQVEQTMNLTIWKDSGIGSTIVCSSQSSGYTGILNCDVTGETGRLRAEVRRTASPTKVFAQLFAEIKSSITDIEEGKSIGLFFGAILLIFFALIGAVSPVLVIILGIIALVPLWLLGSINWAIFTAIAVIGGVIIHWITKRTG